MTPDDPILPMVNRIAASLAGEYEVDVDDVVSEMLMWLLDNKDPVDQLIAEDRQGLLNHRLTSIARRYCAKERAHSLGYDPRDIIQYNVRAIRDLLPDVFDYNDWQPSGDTRDGLPRSKPLANMGMDRVAMLVDIRSAMMQLPEDQYNVIVWVYKYGYTAEQLAAELEITQDAAQKRIQRAVGKIQILLSEVRPVEVPQRRTVVTNATARAIQSGHYDD